MTTARSDESERRRPRGESAARSEGSRYLDEVRRRRARLTFKRIPRDPDDDRVPGGSSRSAFSGIFRGELWRRGVEPTIARRQAGHGSGLDKRRWVVERTFAWLHTITSQ